MNSNPDSEATGRAPLGDTGNAPSPRESAANPIAGLAGQEIQDAKDLVAHQDSGVDSGDIADPRPGGRKEQTIDPKEIDFFRDELYNSVFDYESAVEMAKWGRTFGDTVDTDERSVNLAEWSKLSPEERHRLEPDVPWYDRFAESAHTQGAPWIHLLGVAMDLWNSVPRFDFADNLGDSVFGLLIARLGAVEEERFGKGHETGLSLEVRFSEARNTAWRAVVQETLKPTNGSEKPGRTSAKNRQRNFDATSALRSHSFLEWPTRLRDLLGEPNEKLIAKDKERKGQDLPIKTDLKSVQKRMQEVAGIRIAPTKRAYRRSPLDLGKSPPVPDEIVCRC